MPLTAGQEKIALNTMSAVRRVEDTFALQLATTMRKLERNLTDFIQANQITGTVDTALARQQIEQILVQSGYYETTGALLNEGYQAVVDDSAELYNKLYGKNFQFQDVSLQQLQALKNLDLEQYTQLAGQAVTEINRALTDLQFGSINFSQAFSIIREQVVDKLERYAGTWLTTGLSGIYRESSITLALDNDIKKFQYVGTIIATSRPFCKKHLGEVKTIEEWNTLDNGQLAPISTYMGGWNCRHSFIGVVEE